MNLFVLHVHPVTAARMACDQHVVKMPTETAQMLSTVVRSQGLDVGYKPSHTGHPATKWVGASRGNFEWALAHGFALCDEYTLRFLGVHAARQVLHAVKVRAPELVFTQVRRTPFVQTMPEAYRGPDAVAAYRTFYLKDKSAFARWAHHRKPPAWWAP